MTLGAGLAGLPLGSEPATCTPGGREAWPASGAESRAAPSTKHELEPAPGATATPGFRKSHGVAAGVMDAAGDCEAGAEPRPVFKTTKPITPRTTSTATAPPAITGRGGPVLLAAGAARGRGVPGASIIGAGANTAGDGSGAGV